VQQDHFFDQEGPAATPAPSRFIFSLWYNSPSILLFLFFVFLRVGPWHFLFPVGVGRAVYSDASHSLAIVAVSPPNSLVFLLSSESMCVGHQPAHIPSTRIWKKVDGFFSFHQQTCRDEKIWIQVLLSHTYVSCMGKAGFFFWLEQLWKKLPSYTSEREIKGPRLWQIWCGPPLSLLELSGARSDSQTIFISVRIYSPVNIRLHVHIYSAQRQHNF
jgi:hypothetical protein